MNYRYQIPTGVRSDQSRGQIFLKTREGGRVWVDKSVLRLWHAADGIGPDDVLSLLHPKPAERLQILAGLACLAEAGLLLRDGLPVPANRISVQQGELVSVVVVSYNSQSWLPACLDSLAKQSYTPVEIILVDNGSKDGSADWVEGQHPELRLIRLGHTEPLARALNLGMQAASGKYYLLLNPDVQVEPDAVAHLVHKAASNPRCAAVAAKLRMLWTPAFLNGLGNQVGAISWGTDIGLGHLDLGQFAGWDEIPSTCFAASLIPSRAFETIGPLDEGFLMYYEDSEWCYRARLSGFSIRAAPAAVVYHAFGSRQAQDSTDMLGPAKIRRVTSGRLRFITRINGALYFWTFFLSYALEDFLRSLFYLIRGRGGMVRSIIQGWVDYFQSLSGLLKQRRTIQANRRIYDQELYHLQGDSPVPRIFAGSPQLTWEAICGEYLSLILAGQTNEFPEFSNERSGEPPVPRPALVQTAFRVWKTEGLFGMLRWIGRRIQWRLMQP